MCSVCGIETIFNGYTRVRLEQYTLHIPEYQCQCCGKLKFSQENQIDYTVNDYGKKVLRCRVALDQTCECGGQFRRDKNIFCPNCHHRKSDDENQIDFTSIFINKHEFDNLIS